MNVEDRLTQMRSAAIDAFVEIATMRQRVIEMITDIEAPPNGGDYKKKRSLKTMQLLKDWLGTVSEVYTARIDGLLHHDQPHKRSTDSLSAEDNRDTAILSEDEYRDRVKGMDDAGIDAFDATEMARARVAVVIQMAKEMPAVDDDCTQERVLEIMRLLKHMLCKVSSDCVISVKGTLTKLELK